MADESPLFLGGMWDFWHAREADSLFTFTVLTTFPNEVSTTIHDRMPVIVQAKDHAHWLDPKNQEVADLLAPYPSSGMVAYPVSERVNNPKNDDARLIEPEPRLICVYWILRQYPLRMAQALPRIPPALSRSAPTLARGL